MNSCLIQPGLRQVARAGEPPARPVHLPSPSCVRTFVSLLALESADSSGGGNYYPQFTLRTLSRDRRGHEH